MILEPDPQQSERKETLQEESEISVPVKVDHLQTKQQKQTAIMSCPFSKQVVGISNLLTDQGSPFSCFGYKMTESVKL